MQYNYNHIEVCVRFNGFIKSEMINASHDGEAGNISFECCRLKGRILGANGEESISFRCNS